MIFVALTFVVWVVVACWATADPARAAIRAIMATTRAGEGRDILNMLASQERWVFTPTLSDRHRDCQSSQLRFDSIAASTGLRFARRS